MAWSVEKRRRETEDKLASTVEDFENDGHIINYKFGFGWCKHPRVYVNIHGHYFTARIRGRVQIQLSWIIGYPDAPLLVKLFSSARVIDFPEPWIRCMNLIVKRDVKIKTVSKRMITRKNPRWISAVNNCSLYSSYRDILQVPCQCLHDYPIEGASQRNI